MTPDERTILAASAPWLGAEDPGHQRQQQQSRQADPLVSAVEAFRSARKARME